MEQYSSLKKSISQLGFQMEDLYQNILAIKSKFTEFITFCNQRDVSDISHSSQEISTTATTIAEELPEHKQKRRNLVIYSFPEGVSQIVEKENYTKMCKEISDLEVNLLKIFHIGHRTETFTYYSWL